MKTTQEMISVMQAEQEGKKIQCRAVGSLGWFDIDTFPSWNWREYDYRVKTEQNLRPYENEKEFLDAMKVHGPMLKKIECYTYIMTTRVCSTVVWIIGNPESLTYKDLQMSYEWQDGTPCGVVEKGGEV